MFASNMKILKLNTNNASPNVQAAGGGATQASVKELNNNNNSNNEGNSGSNIVSAGTAVSNHKVNKREQKHNNKAKFIHGNNNKMRQHVTQQQQTQQQQPKYHNNGGGGGGGNKMKKHYNNNSNNGNTTSSLNRKKYYQQQQQQQDHHPQQQQHYQQQQYLAAIQQTINSTTPTTTITITNNNNNNNNSNLVKNQNYTNIDLLVQQQQQQHQNVTHTTNNMMNHTITNPSLETQCTCLLQQNNNCDKLSLSSCSSTSSSSSTASSLPQTTGDYHRQLQPLHTICYDNNPLKTSSCICSALNSNTKSNLSCSQQTTTSAAALTAPSAPTCVSCWTHFTKLPQQHPPVIATSFASTNTATSTNLQQFVASAVAAAVASKCSCNPNLTRATSASSSTSLTTSTTSSTTISSLSTSSSFSTSATKKKQFWKNSNTGSGAGAGDTAGSGSLSSSGYSTGFSTTHSPKVSKDKVNVLEKTTGNSVRQSLAKSNINTNTNNNGGNVQKYSTTVGANNINTTQQKQASKQHPIQAVDKTAMNTSLTGATNSALIKTSVNNSSNSSSYTSKIASPKQQCPNTLEKHNESKQTLKTLANNVNSNSNSDSSRANGSKSLASAPGQYTTTTTSSTSTVSASVPTSPNSYTLDFLHSVGVQMTGVTLRSSGVQGSANAYGNQSSTNSPSVHNSYPYTNHRQPRYMYGGANTNNSGNQQQQQHHYHHQPSQLTIASFLQKDLLGGDILTSNSNNHTNNNGGPSTNNTRNVGNYNDQQYTPQHQQAAHPRFHHNYYGAPYQQQQQTGGIHNTNYAVGGYGGEFVKLVTNGNGSGGQRNACYGYTNYHNMASNEAGVSKNNTMPLHQNHRQLQSNQGNYTNSSNNTQANKKSSYASSTTSSCSSSSSKSISSNSSNTSGRQMSAAESNNGSSNLNLAIETLPSKSLGTGNQRGNHRGHHHSHHGHHHHNHNHNHHGHHHHQHTMMNSPSILQHQNYYNLTYVSTDGSVSGSASRGCSPAPQSLPPTPLSATNCHSPKTLENSPGPVAMLMNFNTGHLPYPRYSNTQQQMAVQQQQQFHQFQQQQHQHFFNKKMLVPLTLTMPSPSPSPTSLVNASNATLNTQQVPPPPPHNIICCSQLDEATTAAAAAAASSSSSSGIIAGNDYDSDSSSNHSSTQHKFNSLKATKSSSLSSSSCASSSASVTSLPLMGLQAQSQACSQPVTPSTCGPATPLHSPLDYNYSGVTTQTFPNLQVAQHLVQQQQQNTYKSNNDSSQLPQIYGNNTSGVISLLNLPTKCPNNYVDDDYQQQQPHQFYFNTSAGQNTADHLNIASALNAVANSSNNSSGYWSSSPHNNQFIYQQTSAPVVLMPPTTSSSSSCGSSSASISPRLPNDDLQQPLQQQSAQQQLHHNSCLISGSSSPSPCTSCLSEQFSSIIVGSNSNSDSGILGSNASTASGCSSSGSGISNISSNGGHNYKRGSTQLLAQQQQRLIAQQTYQSSSSSTSSLSSSSASTLTSAVRARGTGAASAINSAAGRNNNHLSMPQNPLTTSAGAGNASLAVQPQQLTAPPSAQHLYSHHQQQPLPPPLPPHNLLYNNPQTHHMRALNTISSSVHDFFSHTPPDRFLARAHLVEAKEAPATLLNNSKWDNLSEGIWKKFINSQQTEETFKQKMRLWRYLYLFIKNAYPRYGLYLVGSTISGFGSDSSDVDMCLVSRSASSIDPRMEALFNLTVLRDCLSKSGEFENFNLIEAKVPILRFRDRIHQLEVDLNFNNCVGIKNTHLLYCYSQLDWRLRPLVLVTKLWAQYHNINNAKNMTISSYSLVLMVIHFLQYAVNPPVLPCLHDIFPDKFPLLRSNDFGYIDLNETMGPYESKNFQTIGELFLYFLEYYSCFDYTQFAISVRTGGLLPINVCRIAKSIKNDIHQWKELCIEEPFDLTNTARSVYDYETFERVKAVFVASWRVLQETLDLNSVFLPIIIPTPCTSATNLLTNTIATSATTAFSEIDSDVDVIVTDAKTNLVPYANTNSLSKDFCLANTTTAGDYGVNNSSLDKAEDQDESINDQNDVDEDTNDMTTTCSTIPNSRGLQKLPKHKDLNRTLTPCQMKVYGEPIALSQTQNITTVVTSSTPHSAAALSPSLTCIKNSTKNVNRNNNNNSKTATPIIS